VEPIKSSSNADIQVMPIMDLLSLAFICIPFQRESELGGSKDGRIGRRQSAPRTGVPIALVWGSCVLKGAAGG
jgi:hypothetical protein